VNPALGYLMVRSPGDLAAVVAAVEESCLVGLDTETVGRNPRAGRIRLLSLNCDTSDGGRFTYVVDCAAVDPRPLFAPLAEKELAIHNALFDLGFLGNLGFVPGVVHCTMLMARLLSAGTYDRCSLAACCERELGVVLDKQEQRSDWSGELTESQLAYAARDAEMHVRLYRALVPKIKQAGLKRAARIEDSCLPAFAWLSRSGASFDQEAWAALVEESRREAVDLADQLDAQAPSPPDCLPGCGRWNWDSPADVLRVLRLLGFPVESTDDETLASVSHPLADLVRGYRAASKRQSGYGGTWLKRVESDGRIYADWNQLGSVAGRTSCSEPNLQQVPRDPRYRRCFSAPTGRVLVKADYSQLQLRIAAKVANEPRMLAAYVKGEDLHTLTAQQITGKDTPTREDRQLAKAVNFGLLFGLGAKGLQGYARSNYGLNLSEGEARRYRAAFFAAYPGLARWHRAASRQTVKESRTLAGRRRLLDAKTPYTHRLNSPVQGTEADGMKAALALLWERRAQAPGAFPMLVVHDEIVIEADADQAEAASAWVRQAMLDGMAPLIAPVPVEVEVKTAQNWAGE
jgi:DNA polymerase-1